MSESEKLTMARLTMADDGKRQQARDSRVQSPSYGGGYVVPGRYSQSMRRYGYLPPPPAAVQRKASPETESKPEGSRATPAESNDVHRVAQRGVSGSASALPFEQEIQTSFGAHDVSGVNAHVGGVASEATELLGATAYATGSDVAFAHQPDLHTAAHEAAHVVQQRRGGVQLKGGIGQVGDAYEKHADAVADLVVQGKSAEGLLSRAPSGGGQGAAVQKLEDDDPSVDSDGGTLTAASGKDDAHEPSPGPAVQKRSSSNGRR